MDRIAIDGLRVDCVVGVYPRERNTPQPLTLDVELRTRTEDAARSERLSGTIDYAALSAQLTFLLQSCRFELLETAGHALMRYLLLPPAPGEWRAIVQSARLRLSKPGALAGRAVPSLTLERPARWPRYVRENKAFGTVDVIHETRDAGIYRLNIAPGCEIPLHYHEAMTEAEMVLGPGLLCQDREVAPGTVHRWPARAAHRYRNPSPRFVSVLCVDAPPFVEAYEIPATGEPTHVHAEHSYLEWFS